ncbi:aminoglycoside phosphotransferase family protein [Nocardia sp. NBC_01009]|uniref:aminoglycoside phosphotransferase family protein n=1 Tax=Nocardia sp. NBC_01009 TaxID=2975996 RepID=UPI00386D6F22|nr:aminoglycoside phosphotransferase family protein [Nocardia sp. NBC_01009]
MIVPAIPNRLEKAIIFLRGEQDGRSWLDALPARIANYARQWDLALDSIADSGAMSCCVYCTAPNGTPAVLKIPVDQESGHTEMALLERWAAANSAPAVLQRASTSGVFLMTRIIPGAIAWPDNDGTDSTQFGELLTQLNQPHLPEPPELKDLADIAHMRMDWARERFADPQYAEAMKRFGATTHLAHAENVLDALLRTSSARHVLHADLQAKNILQGPSTWYAIDPLGAVGDINAEAALWIAIQNGPTSISERLDHLNSHPLLDHVRLCAWTFVFAVAEYRPYLPAPAERIEIFIENVDPMRILDEVGTV